MEHAAQPNEFLVERNGHGTGDLRGQLRDGRAVGDNARLAARLCKDFLGHDDCRHNTTPDRVFKDFRERRCTVPIGPA
jgi:hypothetical protein